MRLAIHDCIHCGTEYTYQWSGSYDAVDTPKEYRDEKYCPECKEKIVEALKDTPKKFAYQNIVTDEVDLDTLLRWEKEEEEEYKQKMKEAAASGQLIFPKGMRVFAGTMNIKTGEKDIIREVVGREDKKGRIYIYSYWSSDKSRQRITVERQVNLITGEQLRYKIKN